MSTPNDPRAVKPVSAQAPQQALGPAPNKGPNDPQVPSPRDTKAPRSGPGLALPHERDESPEATPAAPDAVISQAKRDIDAGMVDTDMWATPGLDAAQRERLVPGPGGQPTSPISKPRP